MSCVRWNYIGDNILDESPSEGDSFVKRVRFGRNEKERFIYAVIGAYFDDSSDPKMAEYVSCGGIVEDEFKIAALEVRWRDATADLKKPFRSTDCECQFGQFSDWSKAECDALMAKLVGLVSDGNLAVGSYATIIPIPVFKRVFPARSREAAYLLAVSLSIVEMARLAQRYNEKVKLVFEEGSYDGKILTAYKALKNCETWDWDQRGRLSGISFEDKSLVALQSADLVAREGFKWAINRGKRNVRKPLLKLWDRVGLELWLDDAMEAIKERGGPENPSALVNLPEKHYMRRRNLDHSWFSTKRVWE